MKKISSYIVVLLLTGIVISISGCKKFLKVVPIDDLAGNNFWKTEADYDAFTAGIYNRFRKITMVNSMFFVATGDLRCAPTVTEDDHDREYFINDLRKNDLGTMLGRSEYDNEGTATRPIYPITEWNGFYAIIQHANILYEQSDSSTVLTSQERKHFQAEAVFLRCLSYFFMVRIYGDVSYYTEAFHSTPLPRTDMLEVLSKCIADLSAVKDDLPWTYDDPSMIGTRAMRGSAIALLMHMHMWCAGFDPPNAQKHYEATAALGKEVMEDNQGAYGLVPLNETYKIFRGHSKESLFELVQNYNSGEKFSPSSSYSTFVLTSPYVLGQSPYLYYEPSFILKIYPRTDTADDRPKTWFKNLYSNSGMQTMIKFIDSTRYDRNGINMNNRIVFRYTDAVLLRAEALADLDKDDEAIAVVNLIRNRAGAPPFTSAGQELKDDIYWERVRALMGEGFYYYDLVRTHKLTDGSYCFAPITVTAFNQGAWTWPIDISALDNNPSITLNSYWQ